MPGAAAWQDLAMQMLSCVTGMGKIVQTCDVQLTVDSAHTSSVHARLTKQEQCLAACLKLQGVSTRLIPLLLMKSYLLVAVSVARL